MIVKVYRIEPKAVAAVKKVVEEPEAMKEVAPGKQEWFVNEWARNGYSLRDASSMGLSEQCSYLYVKAETDEFFKKNEKAILVDGVKELKGDELEKIRKKVEEEQDNAAAGVGAIFGNL